MTDIATLELIDRESIYNNQILYNRFAIMNDLIRSNNSDLQLLHVQLTLDTSTENTLTESTVPTNKCLSTGTALQVYLHSDNSADTSKNIDVIGQKEDGSFGLFTLTTDDSDGTTPVDVGEWNVIMCIVKNDDFTGNAIIDDDGLSGTVYFTGTLGASDGKLTLSGLSDYKMYFVDIHSILQKVQASSSAFLIEFSPFVTEQIQMSLKFDEIIPYCHCISTIDDVLTQIELKTVYIGTMTDIVIDLYLAICK